LACAGVRRGREGRGIAAAPAAPGQARREGRRAGENQRGDCQCKIKKERKDRPKGVSIAAVVLLV